MEKSVIIPKIPFLRRHRNFFVGLFIIIPLIGIPGFVTYSLIATGLMEDWIYLYTVYDDPYGLEEGNTVTYRSQKIGYVNHLKLMDEGVRVELKINKTYLKYIKSDSKAMLAQKFFVVGDWWISMTVGSHEAKPINDGDLIASSVPFAIQSHIEQVFNMLTTMNTLMAQIDSGTGPLGKLLGKDSPMEHVFNMLKVMDKLMTQIDSGTGPIGKLLGDDSMINLAQEIGNKTNALMDEADNVFKKVNKLLNESSGIMHDAIKMTNDSKEMLTSAQSLIGSMKTVMADMRHMIELYNRIPKSMHQMIDNYNKVPVDMKGLITNYNNVSDEMLQMMTDMKQFTNDVKILFKALEDHWFFRGAIKKYKKKLEQ